MLASRIRLATFFVHPHTRPVMPRAVAPRSRTAMVKSGPRVGVARKVKKSRASALASLSRRAQTGVGSMSGRGAYSYANPGPWGRYGRQLGALAGRAVGGPIGAALGGEAGSLAHYIGRIFGSGDYITNSDRVKYNVLVNESQVPQFGSNPNEVHIRHREYIGDIFSSGTANAFSIANFAINPGQFGTFQWLSQVCGATFQQYRINGMIFEFRSMSSDALNNVNTALGSVIMATDYDSADVAFTNKSQMENTEFGVSCKPSVNMIHAIECARNQTSISEQYIRPGAVPAGADIRLYDLGRFSIATVGFQGTNVNCGELWVSYDVTLFKAIQTVPGVLIPTAHYVLDPAQVGTKPLALLAGGTAFDTIGLTFNPNGLALSFPLNIPTNSKWIMCFDWSGNAGSAALATALDPTPSGGMVNLNVWGGSHGVLNPSPTPPGANVRQVTTNVTFSYDGSGTPAVPPTLTFGAPATPLATYITCHVFITMANGSLI